MNILEEIQNCPVEWKELGEVVFTLTSPVKLAKKQYQLTGRIPIVDQGEQFIAGYTDNEKYLEKDEYIIFGDHSEHIKFVDFAFVQGADGLKILKPKKGIDAKYLYYCVCNFYKKEGNYKRHWSNAKITLIPIPSLEIQEKIVQILDKMTDYVTELTSELTSRKKQYSYYRDKLLSFENEVYQVEWKTLAAVSEKTSNISWNKIGDDEKFKYIDLSSVDRVFNKIIETTSITKLTAPSRAQQIVKSDDIILGTTRPTLKRFTKITDDYNDQICSTGFYVFRTNGEVLPNYVYHIFSSSNFYKYLKENQSGASYPAISDALVKKYKIPVPSLEIQSRIVQVLDNFDMVCHDLNIGLPKEIELRQKQYEYFREKLLTFVAEGEYTESRVE